MGWGHQHIVDMPKLLEQYEERKQLPLLNITDVEGQKEYYDREMNNGPEEQKETMLCGTHMNLYGGSIRF
jgi:hypothetical protein